MAIITYAVIRPEVPSAGIGAVLILALSRGRTIVERSYPGEQGERGLRGSPCVFS